MRNKLFLKLSLIFLVILSVLGGIIAYISNYSMHNYYEEANQKLNAEIAQYTVDHVETFTPDGAIDTNTIQEIMESMMIINPVVEVYLVDSTGKILAHVAPYKEVIRKSIDLQPVKEFIRTEGNQYLKGDDPRDPQGEKVFSAAPVRKDGKTIAYYYIVLASEERASVLSGLKNNYTFRLGIRLLGLTLLVSLILGLLAIWYQTKNLTNIAKVMLRFKSGDYSARIKEDQRGDFTLLSDTFNDMAQQIEQYIGKIESIDSFRKELIANISHDLRTPLSIIQGYTETLILKRKSLRKSEKQEYIENINESSKRLSGLVKQLFELSKLESNQIQIQKEPFALDELTKDMLHRNEILASEKNIRLSLNKQNNLPLAFGDVGLVERVIQNLIDNALKFTPKNGEITMEIGHNEKQLIFQISDTGKGIPEKMKSVIFERYIRSEPSVKKDTGTGLGLAIAKKIIELHDSTIHVQSKLNVGSTFSFNLPVYSM